MHQLKLTSTTILRRETRARRMADCVFSVILEKTPPTLEKSIRGLVSTLGLELNLLYSY